MPRKTNINTVEETNSMNDFIENVDNTTVENMNKITEEIAEETAEKPLKVESLNDNDEIKVVSLIPNVSYKDSHTGDIYEWNEVGHVEYMTFETLKNMWRNSKAYFKEMWLKPMDDRVINKFGLTSTFEKYEFLMDEASYTRDNIDKLCDSVSNTPNGLKLSICNKIKNLVATGKVTDVSVIRAMEWHLNLDLISSLS